MLRRKSKILFLFLFACLNNLPAQVTKPVGLWKFDDSSNLTKAEIGKSLELIGAHTALSNDGNGAVKIGKGSYYKIDHGIIPKNNSYYVNEYSLQIDFRVPTLLNWHCFFQTSPTNSNDGECFVDLNGAIGVSSTGYSFHKIKTREWYRLIISVKNGIAIDYYLDGEPLHNGVVPPLHGRFALDKTLLLFADNDGEDGEIDCAEVALWDFALSADEAKNLGGYGHTVLQPPAKHFELVPYLQAPTANTIYISWHDRLEGNTKVEFGETENLGNIANGASEIVYTPYRWHTVKLENLKPNTKYFYKAVSQSGQSKIYSFQTQPDENYSGKLRFLLLSDTHSYDSVMVYKVMNSAKAKLMELYGDEFQNKINMVLHSGDLVMSGNLIAEWTKQYFAPMSVLSPNIPFMTVSGNHEGENRNYFSYMKYDDFSVLPDDLNERLWFFTLGNTAFVGLNSNLLNYNAIKQVDWLDKKLAEIEANPKIDFVFLMLHHLPISELWGEGVNDVGSNYVKNQILPVLKKYSKVVQLSYGHTHGFERGTIESDNGKGDFRIVCGGGGGGDIDRWNSFRNHDYPNIHIAYDHFSYQIIEIDVAEKTFSSSLYSLGNESKKRNSEILDSWYKKINQPAPDKPAVYNPTSDFSKVTFRTSKINADSLMSVHIQVSSSTDFKNCVVDELVNWKNIFKVDQFFVPTDLNSKIDLTKLSYSRTLFEKEGIYFYRVKYRDHNLKWSDWSNPLQFSLSGEGYDAELEDGIALKQNYPNPYNATTKIIYKILQKSFVTLKVYDILGNEVATLVDKEMEAGEYFTDFDGKSLSSGVYFYKLQAGNFSKTKKLTLIR